MLIPILKLYCFAPSRPLKSAFSKTTYFHYLLQDPNHLYTMNTIISMINIDQQCSYLGKNF